MTGKMVKCALLSLSLNAAIMAAQPTNLLSNGGFESGVTGWSLGVNGDTAKATRSIDSLSGTAQEGKCFHRIVVTAVSSQNWHVQLKDPTWEAKMDHIYHLSLWARADAERQAQISVYGSPDSKDTYRTSSTIALTTEWKQYHQMFISDAEGMGQINFAFVCGFAVGTYDIDGVVLTEKPNTEKTYYANGGFEADGAGWSLFVNAAEEATGAAEITYPTEGARSGSKFGRITVTALPASDWEVQLQDGSWTAALDAEYAFSFWAKADDARVIKLAAQGGPSREYEYLDGEEFTLTTEWQQYSFPFISPVEGMDSVSFNIYCGAELGVYDFDDITLSQTVPVKRSFATPAGKAPSLSLQLLPERLRCTLGKRSSAPVSVGIFDMRGRLFSTMLTSDVSADGSFDLPRPPRGTWIVGVNSGLREKILVP